MLSELDFQPSSPVMQFTDEVFHLVELSTWVFNRTSTIMLKGLAHPLVEIDFIHVIRGLNEAHELVRNPDSSFEVAPLSRWHNHSSNIQSMPFGEWVQAAHIPTSRMILSIMIVSRHSRV